MDYSALARESLDPVAASKPPNHQNTNVVVTNDSANLTLAFGALPVMAYAPQEVAEMAAISQALVLNIGTLSEEEIVAMLLAGHAAGEKGIPIVLDPVGAGATRFRTESATSPGLESRCCGKYCSSERPIIRRTMSSWLALSRSSVPTYRPSRSTLRRSQSRKTSGMRCET